MLENIKSSVLKSKNISPFLVPSEHHRLSISMTRLSKTSLYFLSCDNVLMLLVAGHLVILCGFLRVFVRGSSLGSRISFNTRSFMLLKWRIFCPR